VGRTGLAFVLVFVCTLFPFDFERASGKPFAEVVVLAIGPDVGQDVAGNVLLFLPLGVALSGRFGERRVTNTIAIAAVLATSAVTSYVLEVTQQLLPGRTPSLNDVLANGAGGVLGFVGHAVWRRRACSHSVAGGYLVGIVLVSVAIQWSTTVANWDPGFWLSIGNERTGDRPWLGRVFDVTLLDRPLSAVEVKDLQGGRDITDLANGAVVAAYDLSEPCPCLDTVGRSPALVRRTQSPGSSGPRASRREAMVWLQSDGPAAHLVRRVRETSAFTLAVTLASDRALQWGPARILSISADTERRNLMLGQSGRDLVVRLRTPLTGPNGTRPVLRVPDAVMSDGQQHRLVVTYDGADLRAYVDGASRRALRFSIGVAAFGLPGTDPGAFPVADVVYYAAVLVPAGMLLWTAGAGREKHRPWLIVGAIVATPVLLELTLVLAAGREFAPLGLLWGSVALSAGTAFSWAMDGLRPSTEVV
jgi:hypothetical protein